MLFVILWSGKDKWKGTITNLLEELEEEFPSEALTVKTGPRHHKLLEARVKRAEKFLGAV